MTSGISTNAKYGGGDAVERQATVETENDSVDPKAVAHQFSSSPDEAELLTVKCVESESIAGRNYKQPRNRFQAIDLARGFGILCIIQVHIVENVLDRRTASPTAIDVAQFFGGPFVAPLFLFLMGFNLIQPRGLCFATPKQVFQRGCVLFLKGVLLNLCLNASLLIKIYFYGWKFSPFSFVFAVDILPCAGVVLVLLAMGLTLLEPLCNSTSHRLTVKSLVLVSLGVSVSGVTPLVDNYLDSGVANGWQSLVLGFIGGNSGSNYFPFFPWGAYPLLGAAAAITWFKLDALRQRLRTELSSGVSSRLFAAVVLTGTLALLGVVVVPFAGYWYTTSIQLAKYYHHGLAYYLWCLCFFPTWLLALDFFDRCFGRSAVFVWLKWMGANVTRLYVSQWLLLGNFITFHYQQVELSKCIAVFVFVLLASNLMTLGYQWLLSLRAAKPPEKKPEHPALPGDGSFKHVHVATSEVDEVESMEMMI
mmetsp:Transcript_17016/g.33203  ORF Transcript_17016/g.33203 Transcript_17016/m.33203 type:complete len:478 (+) Transcript_17016:149-1582(+)|eukprot:CAMPEP_0175123164 /NCGR_PEP_ID=MMETSP0087-20121206/2097_1 /TAXON_ID=136419 /ORGANISM="Unknown Unknown, Strain D1" /LENGTH=477 /DNA_ID=CAMNT_0016404837 /DNA_START=71 /DNA_END=1504 /DNA_ORIENTATION=+